MKEICILNIYQLNVYIVLNIMFKLKNGSVTDAFQEKFRLTSHCYFTRNSTYNFKERRLSLKITKFAILSRGTFLWNKFLHNNTKAFTSSSFFQKTLKNRFRKPSFILSKNIKSWVLDLEISVLTFVNSDPYKADPCKTYLPLGKTYRPLRVLCICFHLWNKKLKLK